MSSTVEHSVKVSRAFAVEFKDIERWSVSAFRQLSWNWPTDTIKPLSAAMTRSLVPLNGAATKCPVPMVTLRFTGEMELRSKRGKDEVKGKLFRAEAGDLVYSKIDVRNGSIGIVPDDIGASAWTTEYPIYKVDASIADALYLKLVIRSFAFQRMVNGLISGASGRKRVEPSMIETLEIPLPSLATQRSIVAHWQSGMQQAAALETKAKKLVEEAQAGFVEALGIKAATMGLPTGRAFAVDWTDLSSWHGGSNLKRLAMGDVRHGRFPVMRGDECLVSISHGCSASPVTTPTGLEVLPISAVTKGFLDLSKRKNIPDRPALRDTYSLRTGDVLMCRTNGTLAYVGMSALVEEDHPDLIFPDKVIRVRPKPTLRPDYLWLLLHTPPLRAQIEAASRTAVGNYAIGGKDIWSFEFPVPPMEVQAKLTKQVLTARQESEKQRGEADELRRKTKAEVEGMVMGTASRQRA